MYHKALRWSLVVTPVFEVELAWVLFLVLPSRDVVFNTTRANDDSSPAQSLEVVVADFMVGPVDANTGSTGFVTGIEKVIAFHSAAFTVAKGHCTVTVAEGIVVNAVVVTFNGNDLFFPIAVLKQVVLDGDKAAAMGAIT